MLAMFCHQAQYRIIDARDRPLASGPAISFLTAKYHLERIMTISSLQYRAHELRVYTHQDFPVHRDPCASGEKQFSAVLAIDTLPPTGAPAHRYSLVFCADVRPNTAAAAVARAFQYGKDIIDGKVQAQEL